MLNFDDEADTLNNRFNEANVIKVCTLIVDGMTCASC